MSKYKLRWMQNFEINNMDFDNLDLAIKMLITLDDGAKLTVTKPTGSIQAYRMSNGKVEWTTYDDVPDETGCDEPELEGAIYRTTSAAQIALGNIGTSAVAPEITLREPSATSILDDIRSRSLTTKTVDHFDELREKLNKLTGINPALIGSSISPKNLLGGSITPKNLYTNTTASQRDEIKLREDTNSLTYNTRTAWLDTMRQNLLDTPTQMAGITHPLLA